MSQPSFSSRKPEKLPESKSYRATENPFMLALSSAKNDFFIALPYADIKKIDHSRLTENRIEIEFWKHLVRITGKRLRDLAIQISRHGVLEVMETEVEPDTGVWVEMIEVLLLDDSEAGLEEFVPAGENQAVVDLKSVKNSDGN
jgi:hypothetical protein